MALIDDINALPTTVGDGNAGHLNNHQVIHAGLKNHASRLSTAEASLSSTTDTVTGVADAGKIVRVHSSGNIVSTANPTLPNQLTRMGWVEAQLATKVGATDVMHYAGTGAPTVAAPVGSVYVDRSGTNGAIRWVKASGTGTAGWVVQYGDTGWRNVASLLIGDWTATTMQIRRKNDLVTLRAQGLAGTSAGFLQLSAAFVSSFTNLNITTSSKVENVFSNSSFALSWRAPGSVNPDPSYWAQGTWSVTSAWPTTLPGTPA